MLIATLVLMIVALVAFLLLPRESGAADHGASNRQKYRR